MCTLRRWTTGLLAVTAALILTVAAPPVRGAAGGQDPFPGPIPAGPGPGGPAFKVTGVEAGSFHTCALDRTNRAWCWGLNARGQLGIGVFGGEARRPVRVGSAFNRYRQISAGGSGRPVPNNEGGDPYSPSHTCGVTLSGTIECRGSNVFDQLGHGTFEDAALPSPIVSPGDGGILA